MVALPARATNLPLPLTRFIGRERECDAVRHLVSSTRLLTLTGSGGCGKTRLALQVARDLCDQFPDGVWLIDLAPLADPSLVPQTVASVFGLPESSATQFPDLLQAFFQTKNTLWVLDNCEHLIEACAELCNRLLRACPDLHILATSREPLNIAGETTLRVPSLALPNLQQLPPLNVLTRCESVSLFVERAQAAQPDLQVTGANGRLIAQICNRLDGIPLAIELAAARVSAFPIAEIAARLDDRFRLLVSGSRATLPRHQTLRASIDWSYDLLSVGERVLLQRLAVFAGGFTLEAAEYVCDDCEGQVFEGLPRLVHKSLVIFELDEKPRYRLLETIRQYAREKLAVSATGDAVRDRHLDYLIRFAEETAPGLHSRGQIPLLALLDGENDNFRAALEWSLGQGRVPKGLRLAAALMWFWERRGYFSEGRARLESLLNQPEAAPRTLVRAHALIAASLLASSLSMVWVGGSKASRPYLEEAITIARAHGDAGKRLQALALTFLSNNVYRYDQALGQAQYDEAWTIAQDLHDAWISALLIHQRAHWLENQNDLKAARQAMEDSRMLFNAAGDRRWEAILFSDLAKLSWEEGDNEEARRRLEIILPYFRETGDRQHLCFALQRLGEVARAEGNYALGKQYSLEALGLAREIGSKLQINGLTGDLGFAEVHDGDLDTARSYLVEFLTTAQELDSPMRIASALLGFVDLAIAEKQWRRAVQMYAVVDRFYPGRVEESVWPSARAGYARYIATAPRQLDKASFGTAWDRGRAMTLEQAVEYALAEPGPPEQANVLPRAATEEPGGLTPREREVAVLIAQGKSNPQIAETLVVSERTVTTHVTHILSKLGFTSRTQVAAWATAKRLTP